MHTCQDMLLMCRDLCKKNEIGFLYTPKIDFFYIEKFFKTFLLINLRLEETTKSILIGLMYTAFEIFKHILQL